MALAVILPMSFVYFVYFCIYVYTLETISLPVTEDTCTLYGNEPIPIMRTGQTVWCSHLVGQFEFLQMTGYVLMHCGSIHSSLNAEEGCVAEMRPFDCLSDMQ